MKTKQLKLSTLALFLSIFANGQTLLTTGSHPKENIPVNTEQEYKWWNLLHYNIAITPDYKRKFIRGTNSLTFSARQTGKKLQIDLQEPMRITGITWKNKKLEVQKPEKNANNPITKPCHVIAYNS